MKRGVSDVKQPAPAYQTSRGAALAKCIIILQTGFCLCVQGTLSVRNLCHIAGVCAGINGKRVHMVKIILTDGSAYR